MQRLRRTSPISDRHSAQIETLTSENKSKHEGDFDMTSLCTSMRGSVLLTELSHRVNQLEEQLQKLTTVPPAKVHACALLRVMCDVCTASIRLFPCVSLISL